MLAGMTKPAPRLIEIFRAGRHVAADGREVEFTAADVQTIADGYDPALSPAPVVVGHPKLDAPAYGWVDRLVAKDGVLFAEEGQVDPDFADLRKAGRFRNRSASFYMPDSPSNPKPGQLYIKHVGWLGAAAPAVKGLKQVSFAENQEGVVEFALNDRRWGFRTMADIARRVREFFIDKEGVEVADQLIPSWQIDSLNEAGQPDADSAVRSFAGVEDIAVDRSAEFAERERALDEREERIRQGEQQQAQAAQQARRDEAVAFADGLIADGCRIKPAQRAAVVELILAMPAETTLSFGEGDDQVEQPAAELFRSFLAGLPKSVDFAEKSGAQDDDTASLDFSAPAGAAVSADALELHKKAKAYMSQNPGTEYLAAVKAVGG